MEADGPTAPSGDATGAPVPAGAGDAVMEGGADECSCTHTRAGLWMASGGRCEDVFWVGSRACGWVVGSVGPGEYL